MKDKKCMSRDSLKGGQVFFFSNSYIFVCYFIHHEKPLVLLYSGTCLIQHTKGPEKCVGLYRMLEYSDFTFS